MVEDDIWISIGTIGRDKRRLYTQPTSTDLQGRAPKETHLITHDQYGGQGFVAEYHSPVSRRLICCSLIIHSSRLRLCRMLDETENVTIIRDLGLVAANKALFDFMTSLFWGRPGRSRCPI